MESIMIITNKYPNITDPNVCVFVQQLVWTMADLGYQCMVIVPLPINLNKAFVNFPEKKEEITENGSRIMVYYPRYVSAGQAGAFMQKARVRFTTDMFTKAVDKVLSGLKEKPDILYSHFICPAGVAASRLGKKYGIPAFMAHGEATYSGGKKYGNQVLKKELNGLKGVIAVSSQNKAYCADNGIVSEDIIEVFPNGYRPERFYKRDKKEARKKLCLPEDKFIAGFCGSFDERKGVLRLQEAVNQLEDVYFVCAGKGKLIPDSSKCLWSKPVNNDELVWFYSALDVFVLPTEHEGCCNAIVEAIACGCPIISSDRSFNYDICDKTNSILVDPNDVEEIKNASQKLYDNDKLREQLAQGSILKSKDLTLNKRAKNIIKFIKSKTCCRLENNNDKES